MATHHVRQTSHHSKRTSVHVKASKTVSLQKRSGSHGRKSSQKPTNSPKEIVVEDEDEDPMAVSFLNYCTVCEKQIVVPSNTVLYCSESCKKKDSEKSLADYDFYSPPTTPFSNFTFDDIHFSDIIPKRSPTQPHSKRNSYASSCESLDDISGDEYTRSGSDASQYLRQCQTASYFQNNDTVRAARPRYTRASASHINFISTTPSLSHTPTSTSSYSFSMPYTPANRPLPPRTNPHAPSCASKSIDLVTPLTSTSPKPYSCKAPPILRTSTAPIEGEILYAKSPVPSLSPANGSLGRLLASSPPR